MKPTAWLHECGVGTGFLSFDDDTPMDPTDRREWRVHPLYERPEPVLTDEMLRYAMAAMGTGSPEDAERFRLFWFHATSVMSMFEGTQIYKCPHCGHTTPRTSPAGSVVPRCERCKKELP